MSPVRDATRPSPVKPRAARIAVACCLALTPLWLITLFGRGLWTPDEPREADISWRMSVQPNRAIPQLAGEDFLEKPPLAYWAAGWAASVFPDRDAALRAPNLLYAAVATTAVALLAFEAGGATVAWLAALVSGSFVLALQVASWLATDAALMSGMAVALLGFFRGLRSEESRTKAGWYLLMHVGLTLAFMAKGPGGWLVPGLAIAGFLTLERRWSELKRWQLWAGLVVPVCVISAWLFSVARTPEGKHALTVLLWDNVAGRAMHLHSAGARAYAQGHHNWPGKYLVEFPLYVLPWTFLFVAALRRSWHAAREPAGSAWRFALCVLVLPAIALSVATTARGIYAAPLLPGAALLIGLWFGELTPHLPRFDRRMIGATLVLIAVMAVLLLTATAFIAATDPATARGWALAAGTLATALALVIVSRSLRRERWTATVAGAFAAYCLTVITTGIVLFPELDRWQDLGSLMHQIARDAGARPLALYAPDETLTAVADRVLGAPERTLGHVDSVAAGRQLLAQPNPPVFIAQLPGHSDGAVFRRLRSLGLKIHAAAPSSGVEDVARQLGLSIERVYELPQGRRYALLAPASLPRSSHVAGNSGQ